MSMEMDIFPAGSIVLALMITGAVIYRWNVWRHRELEQLSAFANSLPDDERVIFWRLWQNPDLWNTSRYPKAFRNCRRHSARASRTLS